MTPCLPQDDPNPTAREVAIARARDACRWNYTYLPPLGLADQVPPGHGASLGWLAKVGDVIVTLQVNSRRIQADQERSSASHPEHTGIKTRIESGAMNAAAIMKHMTDFIMSGGAKARPRSVADYDKLFQAVPLPAGTSLWDDDLLFARRRVAGPNPMTIQRVGALDDRFPITDAALQQALGPSDSLARAGEEGRLYLADYAMLAGAQNGTFPHTQKYLCAPLALFAVPAGRGRGRALVPVAIQCGQQPGPSSPVFTPADGWGWRMAKIVVQVADGNVHQAVSHLAHTHLVLEPLVVAAQRTLSDRHPVSVLLQPHFVGTLEINEMAQSSLVAPGGGVDMVMAGSIEASRGLVGAARQGFVFDQALLPLALAKRGVDDPEALPDFPYRDDALLVWSAICTWVESYLRVYYPSDHAVQQDTELQRWAAEVGAADGGRLKGFGTDGGRIPSVGYLVDALTMVVFTASAQHAAVNFPQYSVMSYVPNMPLAAYQPAPTGKDGLTEQDLLAMLPPLELAHMQQSLGYQLGSIHHTRLGGYDEAIEAPAAKGLVKASETLLEKGVDKVMHRSHFVDPRVADALRGFQQSLAQIETTIQDRNTARAPYPFLLPSQIPSSINI